MLFRVAEEKDAEAIANLIYEVALPFKSADFTEAGWLFSCEYNQLEKIKQRLLDPEFLTLVCETEKLIVGEICISQGNRITQLFVDEKFRRAGVARNLWLKALERLKEKNFPAEFMVKSSTYAVEFYRRLGFKPIGERQCANGIWFIPMALNSDQIQNK